MTWIVEKVKEKTYSLPAKLLKPQQMKAALSPMAWSILMLLSEKPMYPKEIARKLKMHEQKVYYHIRNLEKSGIVTVEREESTRGALTKFYTTTEPAFAMMLKPFEESPKIGGLKAEQKGFLEPFIEDGKFNALMIMGDPEPHGSKKVRARDGAPTAQLALFLGSFLNYMPEMSVKIDTDVRETDLRNNLIIIGGPGPNAIAERINDKLPVMFRQAKYGGAFFTELFSTLSGKSYKMDAGGIIVKARNPFDRTKQILLIAGLRKKGTDAALISFLKNFDELCRPNKADKKTLAHVVEGIDADNDGVVDSVEFLE